MSAAVARLAASCIVIFAPKISVLAGGSITANALPGIRDVSASGGYVFLSGTTLDVGAKAVTATGGVTVTSNTANLPPVHSSDGYVVLQGSVTGTTSPAAHRL